MKKSILFLCCCLAIQFAYAQKFTIGFPRFNLAYPYVDNPLDCTVQGYPNSAIVLTADKGEIIKSSDGRFIFRPVKKGEAHITVKVKVGKKLKKIGTYPVRVKEFPEPTPMVGTRHSGNISINLLIAFGGVRAILENSDVCGAPFSLISFTVVAMRGTQFLFSHKNIGPAWEKPLVDSFHTLQIGDTFLIYEIACKPPNDDEMILKPLTYTIAERDSITNPVSN